MFQIKEFLIKKRIPDTRRGRFLLEVGVAALCACVTLLILAIIFLRSSGFSFWQRSDSQVLPERVILSNGVPLVRMQSPLPFPMPMTGVFSFLAQELTYEAFFSAAQKDFLVRIPASGWDNAQLEQEIQGAFLRLTPARSTLRLPDGTRIQAIASKNDLKVRYFGDLMAIGDKKNAILGGITGGYVYLSNSPALFFDILHQMQ